MKPLKPLFSYDAHYEHSVRQTFGPIGGADEFVTTRRFGVYLGKPVPVRFENSQATDFSRATSSVFHAAQRPLGHVGSWVLQGVGIASFAVFGTAFAAVGAMVGLARRSGRFSSQLSARQRMKIGAQAGLVAGMVPTLIVVTPVAIAVAIPAVVIGSAAALAATPISAGYAALHSKPAPTPSPAMRPGMQHRFDLERRLEISPTSVPALG